MVEGLLIIIALTLVVGVGSYVYQSARQNRATDQKQPAAASDDYLEFKRLGVKIQRSPQLADITFKEDLAPASLNGVHSPILIYTTGSLTAEYKACIKKDPDQFVSPTAAQLLADADKFGGVVASQEGDFKRNQAQVAANSNQLIKQFDSFYLYYSADTPSPCMNPDGTPNQAIDNALQKLRDTVIPAFRNARQLTPGAD